METYVDSKGKTVTVAQAEAEYRKQMIVTGRPLEGSDYDRGFQEWLGTYRKLTASDKKSIGATTITFAVMFAVVALIAFVALFTGGGLGWFLSILIVGGIVSFITALLVMMFTSVKSS